MTAGIIRAHFRIKRVLKIYVADCLVPRRRLPRMNFGDVSDTNGRELARRLGRLRVGDFPNREEKSLRHVAMVAKFLDDNKPIKSLKSLFALFQTSPILFNFI